MRNINEGMAIAYLRHIENANIEAALALADDTLIYWLPGPGAMDKQQFRDFFAPIGEAVKQIRFNITGSTVEGGRVALEADGVAQLVNGREYRNNYHFVFEIADGKIRAIREYADTAPAMAAFFGPD